MAAELPAIQWIPVTHSTEIAAMWADSILWGDTARIDESVNGRGSFKSRFIESENGYLPRIQPQMKTAGIGNCTGNV